MPHFCIAPPWRAGIPMPEHALPYCAGATTVPALIVSSLGFNLIHLIPTRHLWPFVLWATVEGVTLYTMHLLTRSLLLSIVVHVLNDGVGYAMFAVERKGASFLVLRCRVEFPAKETIVLSNKQNEVVEWRPPLHHSPTTPLPAPTLQSLPYPDPVMSLPLRHMSREWALQVLYQLDIGNAEPEEEAFDDFWNQIREAGTELSDKEWERTTTWTRELVCGVRKEQAFLDELIVASAEHWGLDRMLAIDRNIIRIAVYEMYFCDDIPPAVTINEAVEIAKTYGDPESFGFVNSIIDHINKNKDR